MKSSHPCFYSPPPEETRSAVCDVGIAACESKEQTQTRAPLPPLAWGIIKSVPEVIGRDCLFGARSEAGFTAWGIGKRALDERLGGAVKPWRIHDLRRSTASHMGDDLSVQPHVIEEILSHYSGRSAVAGIYNRSVYEREVRAALMMWSDYVISLVQGGERNVEVICDAERTAGWMGSSESDFCQTVVNRAQSRIWRRDFEPRAKRNELENLIRNVLGEPANN